MLNLHFFSPSFEISSKSSLGRVMGTKLDAIRDGVMDLGITECPPTCPQAMRTCAGVTLSLGEE